MIGDYVFDKPNGEVSDLAGFLFAGLLFGAIFLAYVFISTMWLREHTKGWVPTTAEVLELHDGGDGPSHYVLEYAFDGRIYRVKTKPRLVPTASAKAGSLITVLVNPHMPSECASDVRAKRQDVRTSTAG